MSQEQVNYRHDLGQVLYLDVFAVDPSLTKFDLEEMVKGNKRTEKLDWRTIKENTIFKGRVDSFDELEIEILDKRYQMPKQLQAYRDAIGEGNDAKGWYNGPVAIIEEPMQNPLKVFPGGFYDFTSTKLTAVPSELLPEVYPQGATVEELFKQWGVDNQERAKYLGIAYLLSTNNGNELSLVQRAKGMAIAADCMGSPGSTPNPPFDELGFNFKGYFREHVAKEMNEEYELKPEEFDIGKVYLFDDKRESPFMAVEVKTPLSTGNLAERIYGNEEAIKEHPALYSFDFHASEKIVNQLDVFPSTACVMDVYNK